MANHELNKVMAEMCGIPITWNGPSVELSGAPTCEVNKPLGWWVYKWPGGFWDPASYIVQCFKYVIPAMRRNGRMVQLMLGPGSLSIRVWKLPATTRDIEETHYGNSEIGKEAYYICMAASAVYKRNRDIWKGSGDEQEDESGKVRTTQDADTGVESR